jgi:aspartyl/asparaginyl beta-hydroxylase (cupin superfamily)
MKKSKYRIFYAIYAYHPEDISKEDDEAKLVQAIPAYKEKHYY